MKKQIQDPYWTDDSKTQCVCQFKYENGEVLVATIQNTPDDEDNNPDWDQLLEEHTIKSISENTETKLKNRDTVELDEIIRTKSEREKKKNEDIFQAKIDVFQIEEIKESKDRAMKAKIRKSKSLTEVIAYASILIQNEIK